MLPRGRAIAVLYVLSIPSQHLPHATKREKYPLRAMNDDASMAPASGTSASEYMVPPAMSLPVEGSSCCNLMPVQNDPKESQGAQVSSKLTLGSIALKSSLVTDCTTRP